MTYFNDIAVFTLMKKLHDAVAKNSMEETKVISDVVIEIIMSLNMDQLVTFVDSLNQKISKSKLVPSQINGILHLVSALDDATFIENNELISPVLKVLTTLISQCNVTSLIFKLIDLLFEKTQSIGWRPRAFILERLIKSANNCSRVQTDVIFVLFHLFSVIKKESVDKNRLDSIHVCQLVLRDHLKKYIEGIKDIDQLIMMTNEDTLLGSLIDYRMDALSTFKGDSLRAFVDEQINLESFLCKIRK